MRTWLKWLLYGLGGLVVVLVLAVAIVFVISNNKLGTGYTAGVEAVPIPTDEASIAHGQRMVEGVSACIGCHGEQLEGGVFIDEPGFARIAAPNLTSGAGGIGGEYTDEDWVRALRHGVAGDGRAFFVMPSQWYQYLSDEDLGDIVAYLKTLPPVDNETPARSVAFVPTRFLIALGVFPTSVELIEQMNEALGGRTAPEPGVTEEYGEYLSLVSACRECHGVNLAGGENPNVPMGPNITPGGPFAAYTEADFIHLMRTGETPGSRTVSEEMPWIEYQHMTDEELQAVFMYLQTLEAQPGNNT